MGQIVILPWATGQWLAAPDHPGREQAGIDLHTRVVARACLAAALLLIPILLCDAAQPLLSSPIWTRDFAGRAIGCPMPYGDDTSVSGVLITERTGEITLLDHKGERQRSLHLDLAAETPAVCGDPTGRGGPAIVAVDAWGSVYGFDSSGVRLWKHERRVKSGEFRLPVVMDMDGDGLLEVVVGDSRGCIEVLDAAGQPRLTIHATGYRVSVPAVGDIDGDERCDIVFGTEAGEVHAVDSRGAWLWSSQVEACLGRAFPVLAEVDNYGRKDVYLPTAFSTATPGLFALDALHGATRWRARSVLQSYRSTVVADLDGDGGNEIVFGDKASTLYCLESGGKEMWRRALEGRGIFFAPAVVRAARSGPATIFTVVRGSGARGHSLYALDGTGAVIQELALPGGGGGPPLACRFSGQQHLSLLVLSASGLLACHQVDATDASSRILWAGPRNDVANSGSMPIAGDGPRVGTMRHGDVLRGPHVRVLNVRTGRIRVPLPASERPSRVACMRVMRPSGAVDVRFLRPDVVPADRQAVFDALEPGTYQVNVQWRALGESARSGSDSMIYRVSAEPAPGESAVAPARRASPPALALRQFDNPWQGLDTDALLRSSRPSAVVVVRLPGHAYGSAALALASSGATSSRVRISASPFTQGARSVDPHEVLEWHDVVAVRPDGVGDPVDDALPVLAHGSVLDLEAGVTRKLWLTVRSHGLGHGPWITTLRFESTTPGNPSLEAQLRVDVLSVDLPERATFRQCNWLYPASYQEGPLRDAVLRDALEHGMNVFVIPGVQVTVDGQGTVLSVEGGTHDDLVKSLLGRAFFLVSGPVSLRWPEGVNPDASTRERAFAAALRAYANHMAALGCGFDSFAIYLQDEPGLLGDDATFRSWVSQVRQFKRDEPRLQLYANPAGGARHRLLQEVKGLIDVWAPDLHLVREEPETLRAFFRQASHYWHYEAPGDQRLLDPLGFYRMKPWVAFEQGMTGGGFWVYADAKLGKSPPGGGSEYGTVYMTEQGPVSTIRWEATREGIQDFELLTKLSASAEHAPPALRRKAVATLEQAVAFVTRGQERVTDISRHVRPYAPDYVKWMAWRDRIIALQQAIDRAR